MVTVIGAEPALVEAGDADATVGATVTVKQSVHVPRPPFGLVNVTERGPGVAVADGVTVARRWLASTVDTPLTVTPAPNETFVPVTKPAPVTVTRAGAAPWARAAGATDVAVGPGVTA
jgi:hypothetical protein